MDDRLCDGCCILPWRRCQMPHCPSTAHLEISGVNYTRTNTRGKKSGPVRKVTWLRRRARQPWKIHKNSLNRSYHKEYLSQHTDYYTSKPVSLPGSLSVSRAVVLENLWNERSPCFGRRSFFFFLATSTNFCLKRMNLSHNHTTSDCHLYFFPPLQEIEYNLTGRKKKKNTSQLSFTGKHRKSFITDL